MASFNHRHVGILMLDDLESGVHAGGFSEGFHEGIVPFMTVDYPEYLYRTVSEWFTATKKLYTQFTR